jgi:hypothetical protein
MEDQPIIVGRVLRASTTSFAIGCVQPIAAQARVLPPLGALVKARNDDGSVIYGLAHNIAVEDDPFVRQLVAAGVENEEIIADQRQRRQVPVVVEVLVVGCGIGNQVQHRLPPFPPGTLDRIYECNAAEVVRFTQRHDWLRTVLMAGQIAADSLVIAALRNAAAARTATGQSTTYLIGAGRELATLLALDLTRLDAILRQLR